MEARNGLYELCAGALQAHTSSIHIEGSATFSHNTAGLDGGEST